MVEIAVNSGLVDFEVSVDERVAEFGTQLIDGSLAQRIAWQGCDRSIS